MFAIEREDRDAEIGIAIILGLDHVVLFVAAHAMLRAECAGDVDIVQRRQGVERMIKCSCDGRRMANKADASPAETGAQAGIL